MLRRLADSHDNRQQFSRRLQQGHVLLQHAQPDICWKKAHLSLSSGFPRGGYCSARRNTSRRLPLAWIFSLLRALGAGVFLHVEGFALSAWLHLFRVYGHRCWRTRRLALGNERVLEQPEQRYLWSLFKRVTR